MNIFSVSELSKAYNEKVLFDDISFGMEDGERVGLIGKNGAGKTTLLKIIANIDFPDTGVVTFNSNADYRYLEQLPEFDSNETALEAVLKANMEIYNLLEKYKELCDNSDSNSDELSKVNRLIEEKDAWNYENEAKKMLFQLGMTELEANVHNLSGGQRKRVALAAALLSKPKLLILDEPTNHLDADSVQWLQDRLMNSNQSLLFVTHDRYFLDAVSTRIIEIYQHKIFSYPGNYETYLEQKEVFVQSQEASKDHMINRLRTELAWLQRGARARRSKQKSRKDWIEILKEQSQKVKEKKIKIELGTQFLGSRIIDANNISKSIDNKILFKDFTYIAKPKDRIGIIGPNGSGKSTLLNVFTGDIEVDSGHIRLGQTINIGYFTQEMYNLKDTNTVLGELKEVAEYINVGVGKDRYLTTKDLLNKFLFPNYQHSAFISTLSGGERRRLMLLKVLMANPNVLLLDEPTNDFDIETLHALENYLDNFYGTLIIVSHDRAFLDRTVDFVYAFDGKGNVKQYPGNYSYYLEKREEEKKIEKANKVEKPKEKQIKEKTESKKLSFKEKYEYEKLENEIPILEEKKSELENSLGNVDPSDYQKMTDLSEELSKLEEELDEKTLRWLELGEKA